MTIPASTFPLVQFVSSPDADAEIYYDCNDGLSWPEHDGFSLGAPPLLGDPGGIGAEYGFRTIAFSLLVYADEATAMRQHSELARQLTRDVVYLRVQTSPTAPPVWYRCVRSSLGESSTADVYIDRHENAWRIAVRLVADPFAQGERVSHEVTIANDPAATNGLSVALPDIRGDVPAPLSIDITSGTTIYIRPWLSVCPLEGSRSWAGAVFVQAETGQLGTGATVLAASGASGGSRVQIPMTSSTDEDRAVAWPVTPPYAGRWRVFARVGYESTTAGDMTLRLRGAGAAVSQPNKTVTTFTLGGTHTFMADLGVYTFPKGNMPTSHPYRLTSGGVILNAWWTPTGNAAGRLLVDYIVAVPCDLPLDATGPCVTTDFRTRDQTLGSVTLRLNADDAVVQEFTTGAAAPTFALSEPETPAGEFPQVTPGALNVLTLLTRRSSERGRERDSVTDSTTMTVSYRPRWLYHAGA